MLITLKKNLLALIAVILVSAVSFAQDGDMNHEHPTDAEAPKGIQMSDGVLYGKDYDPSIQVIEFVELMKEPGSNDGKIVLVKGTIAEICQKMGCWMTMTDGTNTVRVKTMHDFFLPKDASGQAVVIGTFKAAEISEKMARHYNDESKNPAVKTEDIVGPQKGYEIEAVGIKILSSGDPTQAPVDPTQMPGAPTQTPGDPTQAPGKE